MAIGVRRRNAQRGIQVAGISPGHCPCRFLDVPLSHYCALSPGGDQESSRGNNCPQPDRWSRTVRSEKRRDLIGKAHKSFVIQTSAYQESTMRVAYPLPLFLSFSLLTWRTYRLFLTSLRLRCQAANGAEAVLNLRYSDVQLWGNTANI
jgi:hypothetical protein